MKQNSLTLEAKRLPYNYETEALKHFAGPINLYIPSFCFNFLEFNGTVLHRKTLLKFM